jgi:hypothetical protein
MGLLLWELGETADALRVPLLPAGSSPGCSRADPTSRRRAPPSGAAPMPRAAHVLSVFVLAVTMPRLAELLHAGGGCDGQRGHEEQRERGQEHSAERDGGAQEPPATDRAGAQQLIQPSCGLSAPEGDDARVAPPRMRRGLADRPGQSERIVPARERPLVGVALEMVAQLLDRAK